MEEQMLLKKSLFMVEKRSENPSTGMSNLNQ